MNVQIDARSIGKVENSDGLLARNTRLNFGDPVHVRVRRFDAEHPEQSEFESFVVPYDTSMRVLDALNYIAENFATDLAYRWLCGTKMCGTYRAP